MIAERRIRTLALSAPEEGWIGRGAGALSAGDVVYVEALPKATDDAQAQAVQAFTHEGPTRARFRDLTERSFTSAKDRIGVRDRVTQRLDRGRHLAGLQ